MGPSVDVRTYVQSRETKNGEMVCSLHGSVRDCPEQENVEVTSYLIVNGRAFFAASLKRNEEWPRRGGVLVNEFTGGAAACFE